MRQFIRGAAFVATWALVACSRPVATRAPRPSLGSISRQDLDRIRAGTVLDAVSRLRSDALVSRAPSSILLDARTRPVVFLDGQYLGQIDELRNIPADGVKEINFYSGVDASRLFGGRYGAGVIQVVSRSR